MSRRPAPPPPAYLRRARPAPRPTLSASPIGGESARPPSAPQTWRSYWLTPPPLNGTPASKHAPAWRPFVERCYWLAGLQEVPGDWLAAGRQRRGGPSRGAAARGCPVAVAGVRGPFAPLLPQAPRPEPSGGARRTTPAGGGALPGSAGAGGGASLRGGGSAEPRGAGARRHLRILRSSERAVSSSCLFAVSGAFCSVTPCGFRSTVSRETSCSECRARRGCSGSPRA